MRLEDEPGVRADGLRIVLKMRAVGGADSTSRAPARAMISGRRNEPPISISWPRETTASLPALKVLSTSSTAAALLLRWLRPRHP